MTGYMKVALALVLATGLAFSGCTSGNDMESKYAKIFSDINKDWGLYEVKKNGNSIIIRVEVSAVVPFKQAKKALAEIQRIDPKLEGYIEFYNADVGMVLRKVEIIPAT